MSNSSPSPPPFLALTPSPHYTAQPSIFSVYSGTPSAAAPATLLSCCPSTLSTPPPPPTLPNFNIPHSFAACDLLSIFWKVRRRQPLLSALHLTFQPSLPLTLHFTYTP
jgi:hypothetical protein